MQLREALKTGLKTLVESGVPSPELAAELLLMHILGRDRGYLYAYPEVEISEEITRRYFQSVEERATGKPTQYITGHQEFWGLDLGVTPDVLIPRPETEHVVEAVIDLARRQGFDREAPLCIVDVGTGSGCIALALAAEFPRALLFATDISRPALDVASRNAARLGMAERVKFLESDLLACFLDARAPGQDFNQGPRRVSSAPLTSWSRTRPTSLLTSWTACSARCASSSPASPGADSSAATRSTAASFLRLARCSSPA